MSDDESINIEYGSIDPVHAFEQTLFDLVQVAETFRKPDTAMTPMEFLQAATAAEERLKAITTITMAGVTGPALEKMPPEVIAEFQSQRELDDLMTSEEDKHRRMMKALRGIANWRRPHSES